MKRIRSRFWLLVSIGLVCSLWTKTGESAGIEPYRWGMTLEELTQVFSKGGSSDSILREDPSRSSVVLPYTPLKSAKITAGRITALVEVKKSAGPESLGRLFGYARDGRLFGRVELFKQTPWFSLSDITRKLKEKFPEGKVFRSFSGQKTVSYFEYREKELYVFTGDEGVYYFEPSTLNKVVLEEKKSLDEKDSKFQEETRELMRTP
jgi:hypothetical protein